MTERSDYEGDKANFVPIPERVLEQTLDTINLDTAYAIKPRDKYIFEDNDPIWYDEETGHLFANGNAILIEPDSTELIDTDEMPQIFLAKIWHTDSEGRPKQSYIADLRSLSGGISRHDTSEAPDEQEYFNGWEAYQKSKREVSAFMLSSPDDDEAEKVGDSSLFDHLDWLKSEVDKAKQSFDSAVDEIEANQEYPVQESRRTKVGRAVRSLLKRRP